MAGKIIVIALMVAASRANAIIGRGANYNSFSYGVADPYTGDFKNQQETRIGDRVVGQYSLLESDGTKRTVDYTADGYNGFNAVVRKDPAYAAPVASAYTLPLAYGYSNGYSAPLVAAYPYDAPINYEFTRARAFNYGAKAYYVKNL